MKKCKLKFIIYFLVFMVSSCLGYYINNNITDIFYDFNNSENISVINGDVLTDRPKVAIVIDDFGYKAQGSDEMLELEIPITLAVMPFSEFSEIEGIRAKSNNKEVIIHMPMESITAPKEWVGSGIFRSMTDEEITEKTKKAFEVLPMAVGMNNHMGTAIMEDLRSLSLVMEEVSKKELFFLDSITSGNSLGEEVANSYNVDFIKRDVFLDSTQDYNIVKENILKAMEIAKEKGYAVAIGHVGVEGGNVTVNAIKDSIEIYKENNVDFVFLSELF